MNTLIARKVGMTQIFDENSNALGVTVLDVSDCRVVQIKNNEVDGYSAAQLTIGNKKNSTKPLQNHYKKHNSEPGEIVFEVEIDQSFELDPGSLVKVSDVFEVGQKASHGVHKVHRAGGSIGNASYPGHVFKGQKMAGRMGNEKSTIQSVTIVGLNEEKNYLLVNGSVPGNKGNIVKVQKAVKVKQ